MNIICGRSCQCGQRIETACLICHEPLSDHLSFCPYLYNGMCSELSSLLLVVIIFVNFLPRKDGMDYVGMKTPRQEYLPLVKSETARATPRRPGTSSTLEKELRTQISFIISSPQIIISTKGHEMMGSRQQCHRVQQDVALAKKSVIIVIYFGYTSCSLLTYS